VERPDGSDHSQAGTRSDRDEALERSYEFSEALSEWLGTPPHLPVPAIVSQNMELLAEWFMDERPGLSDTKLSDAFDRWCVRHFGRRLERVAHGMLWPAVLRLVQRGEGSRRPDRLRPFGNAREQRQWIRAVQECGAPPSGPRETGSTLEFLERVIREAGADLGPGVQSMPDAPVFEEEVCEQCEIDRYAEQVDEHYDWEREQCPR